MRLVEPFLQLMQSRCTALRDIAFDTWWDRKILVGEFWEQEIARAMATSDFGFLCLSPAFLASDYVRRVELPALLAEGRMVVPVGIEPVDLKRADLRGVENLQIFRYRGPGAGARKCFSECGPVNRARFCDQLVGEMVDRFVEETA
jgi:TIR domain